MSRSNPRPRITTRSFEEKYGVFGSEAARSLRASAMGSDVPNGYTTVRQAERLAERLGLVEGQRLLDLGAGRGWPGAFVARECGCRLVASDLPMNALVVARDSLSDLVGEARATVLAADGSRLPFADERFDGVCHADVLC